MRYEYFIIEGIDREAVCDDIACDENKGWEFLPPVQATCDENAGTMYHATMRKEIK